MTDSANYITEAKLNKAKHLLKNRHIKISQISEEIGFVSEPSFYRFFKKAVGQTPQDYRDATIPVE